MTRVLVCGGRDYDRLSVVRHTLAMFFQACSLHYLAAPEQITVVHGGCRGADSLGAQVAEEMGFVVEGHQADWKRYGKRAGPIRNQEMLDSGIDYAFAFSGGNGTADMVRRLKAAGIPTKEIA